MSSAQLAALADRATRGSVELDPVTLAGRGAARRSRGRSGGREALLDRDRLAIVATTRALAAEALGRARRHARRARAWRRSSIASATRSDVLLSKGGITSAVNVRDGLHAERAQIVGPVAPGVSLWLAHEDAGAARRPVIVFPGNVGETDTLAELVDRLLED